jgi:hypothetical protein
MKCRPRAPQTFKAMLAGKAGIVAVATPQASRVELVALGFRRIANSTLSRI